MNQDAEIAALRAQLDNAQDERDKFRRESEILRQENRELIEASQRLRDDLAKAEKALALMGERAVVDWDDEAVGITNKHHKPETYGDWLRSVMGVYLQHKDVAAVIARAEKAEAMLRAMDGAVTAWRKIATDAIARAEKVLPAPATPSREGLVGLLREVQRYGITYGPFPADVEPMFQRIDAALAQGTGGGGR